MMRTYQTLALSDTGDPLDHAEAPAANLNAIPSRHAERKQVSVLFIDVKNSMGLSREIEPQDWWSVSAGLFKLMCDGADRFGGWVGDFAGDGVNAIFEARGNRDHHAWRACLTALWLRDAVRTIAADLRCLYQLELSVRIGINSGEVLTGTLVHRHKRLYTANGYAVALAKRIEELARPNRIYLTEDTAAFVTGAFQLHDLGAVEVKGASAPVRIFELIRSAGAW